MCLCTQKECDTFSDPCQRKTCRLESRLADKTGDRYRRLPWRCGKTETLTHFRTEGSLNVYKNLKERKRNDKSRRERSEKTGALVRVVEASSQATSQPRSLRRSSENARHPAIQNGIQASGFLLFSALLPLSGDSCLTGSPARCLQDVYIKIGL